MSNRSPSALMLVSLSVLLTCLVVFAVLWVGQSVRSYEQSLDHMNHSIASEKERIRVLRAEWARLNTPERLEFLRSQSERSSGDEVITIAPNTVMAPSAVIPVRKPISSSRKMLGGQDE